MFYFLTFERGGDGPYDNTQILAAHPEAMGDPHHPAWGPVNSVHYWGEPLFGYYASDDTWVLRKHAQMLANAGVDVVIFDNSNAVTYDRARQTLCKVWMDIRRAGGTTPQIAFLCPFGNPDGIGTSTLSELYDTLYEPGLYSDLWFRWNGKPLVMADASYASADALQRAPTRQPTALTNGVPLGQTFTADRPFTAAGGEFPTWATTTSGMMLSLYTDGPRGKLVARQTFSNVRDNATVLLQSAQPLPAGKYYLEMSAPVGQIGWWSFNGTALNGAYEGGEPVSGGRTLQVRYAGEAQPVALTTARQRTPAEAAERAQKIRDFFTFRTPIAPYDIANPTPGGWAWLQNYPQAAQKSPTGEVEQITVGVAQNYNATTHLGPMSYPGAFGRTYHAGHRETGPNATRIGYNFDEQWRRALEIDPPFVFITGWNEWTAGFYTEWAGYKAPPPIFVDEFNEEYSRDIEPMVEGKGRGKREEGRVGEAVGHGDDYYYQLVANVRRYKGARSIPPVTPFPLPLKGTDGAHFDAWRQILPEYRDWVGDTAHRSAVGVGKVGTYVNNTGRNDIVAAKVSYDAQNVLFYVRTHEKLTPHTDPDWMLLYLDVDGNSRTGWLGYDFVINRNVDHKGMGKTSLERWAGNGYRWKPVAEVTYRLRGNELEITVPRKLLGITHLPATIDFKWADHCYSHGDWTDFTLNGDAAPDDRFNYRATIGLAPSQ